MNRVLLAPLVDEVSHLISSITQLGYATRVDVGIHTGRQYVSVRLSLPQVGSLIKFEQLFLKISNNTATLIITKQGRYSVRRRDFQRMRYRALFQGFEFCYDYEDLYGTPSPPYERPFPIRLVGKTTISKKYRFNFLLSNADKKILLDKLVNRLTVCVVTEPTNVRYLAKTIKGLKRTLSSYS